MKNETMIKILHALEDATAEGRTLDLTALKEATGKSETTVRKTLVELVNGGFAHRPDPATAAWLATSKHDTTQGEQDMPDPSTQGLADLLPGGGTKKAAAKKAPAKKAAAKKAAPAKKATAKSAGRPRSAEVEERDATALKLIEAAGKDGIGVDDIAKKMNVERSLAYVSVWRLSKAKKVNKTSNGTRTPIYVAA